MRKSTGPGGGGRSHAALAEQQCVRRLSALPYSTQLRIRGRVPSCGGAGCWQRRQRSSTSSSRQQQRLAASGSGSQSRKGCAGGQGSPGRQAGRQAWRQGGRQQQEAQRRRRQRRRQQQCRQRQQQQQQRWHQQARHGAIRLPRQPLALAALRPVRSRAPAFADPGCSSSCNCCVCLTLEFCLLRLAASSPASLPPAPRYGKLNPATRTLDYPAFRPCPEGQQVTSPRRRRRSSCRSCRRRCRPCCWLGGDVLQRRAAGNRAPGTLGRASLAQRNKRSTTALHWAGLRLPRPRPQAWAT